jgi:hypothetical protein
MSLIRNWLHTKCCTEKEKGKSSRWKENIKMGHTETFMNSSSPQKIPMAAYFENDGEYLVL